jgi:hypothetical protein
VADFIGVDFSTDATTIEEQVYEYIQSFFPDWLPREPHLEVILTEAWASVMDDTREMIVNVAPSIFTWFGQNLVDIPFEEESFATVTATVSANSPLPQILRQGTTFLFDNADGDTVSFVTTADVPLTSPDNVAPATTAVGAVTLRAEEAGFDSNDLDGSNNVRLFDLNDWYGSITIIGSTSGGADAEDPDSYLSRLADRLQLMKDGPVLASDVPIYLRTLIPGITRAVAIDNYIPGINEVQKLDFSGTPTTSGTYTLGFTGTVAVPIAVQTTAAINAVGGTAADVQAALEALPAIDPGDVYVTGGPGPNDLNVEFRGQYEGANINALTLTPTGLSGGAALATSTAVQGVAPVTNAEKALGWSALDDVGNEASLASRVLAQAALQTSREVGFLFGYKSPSFSTWSITVNARLWTGFDQAQAIDQINGAIQTLLDPTLWGQSPLGEAREWQNKTSLSVEEINRAVLSVDAVKELSLATTFNRDGRALDASSPKTLPGAFPIPLLGAVTINTVY